MPFVTVQTSILLVPVNTCGPITTVTTPVHDEPNPAAGVASFLKVS